MSPLWVKVSRPRRWRQLHRGQKLEGIDATGLEHLQQAVKEGKGVLITPNHSAHYDSAALYAAADKISQPLFFMTAWQVFAMSSRFECWAMQRLGCFSIDRESTDRQAFKQAVKVLQEEPHPLVIFPEGDIYHVSDRVTPFREGAAAIALSAIKRCERPVVVIPCGIKFKYVDDPTENLLALMARLEDRLLLRPHSHAQASRAHLPPGRGRARPQGVGLPGPVPHGHRQGAGHLPERRRATAARRAAPGSQQDGKHARTGEGPAAVHHSQARKGRRRDREARR